MVLLEAIPYKHCIVHCVRQAFLCGFDQHTRRSFEYRQAWIVKKIAELSSIFDIDVADYAVMSNHCYLVL